LGKESGGISKTFHNLNQNPTQGQGVPVTERRENLKLAEKRVWEQETFQPTRVREGGPEYKKGGGKGRRKTWGGQPPKGTGAANVNKTGV